MYFSTALPLRPAEGVSLAKDGGSIRRAQLTCGADGGASAIAALPWDRYMRLEAAAREVRALAGELGHALTIIDLGGFEGALALFLPEHEVYVVDPATTGGSGLSLDSGDQSFDVSVSLDVIEHLLKDERPQFLGEQLRVSSHLCLVGYPSASSIAAQEVVLEITDDRQVHEHIEFGLPDDDYIKSTLEKMGAVVDFKPHTAISLWATYAALSGLNSMAAALLSKYLIDIERKHHRSSDEPCVYQLAIARRVK